MQIDYSYKDVPTVKAFSESNKRLRGLMGCFGSGKSSGCVIEILKRSLQQTPGVDGIARTRWAVIRNSYPQLRDTTIKTFFQWIKPGIHGTYNKSEHTFTITAFDGYHIEVLFRALDRPEHVSNLLSLELTGAWVNEAREVPLSIIQALEGRCGRFPRRADGGAAWYGVFMDTNPPDNDSWWYKLFEETKPSNAAIFKQPSGLSPEAENLANLPEGYYENLKEGKSDDYIKVYIHGAYGFIQDGRPVFPEYIDKTHCKEFDLIPGGAIHIGMDFGLTPAATLAQVSPAGQLRTFDELFLDEIIGIDRFSDILIRKIAEEYPEMPVNSIICDPAGEQRAQTDEATCMQILRNKFERDGMSNVVRGGEQSPQIRQESVRKGLTTLIDGEPASIIHPRCRVLRKGRQGKYRFKRVQTGEGVFKDSPDKNVFSHLADADQYLHTKFFGRLLLSSSKEWKPIKYPAMGII